MTKPLRLASKGREACSGSSLLGDVALMASKQAIVIGDIGESDAPVMQTSARPSSMVWKAYPTASSPEVQPVETVCTGPCAPNCAATTEASVLGENARCSCGSAVRWSTSHRLPPSLTRT